MYCSGGHDQGIIASDTLQARMRTCWCRNSRRGSACNTQKQNQHEHAGWRACYALTQGQTINLMLPTQTSLAPLVL